MQNSTAGAATLALIILSLVSVSTGANIRSRRAAEVETAADSQAQADAINSPLGPGPRQNMSGRSSSRLAAHRQHQLQLTHSAASSAFNILGSPSMPYQRAYGAQAAQQKGAVKTPQH
jgi:hypothetical protein